MAPATYRALPTVAQIGLFVGYHERREYEGSVELEPQRSRVRQTEGEDCPGDSVCDDGRTT